MQTPTILALAIGIPVIFLLALWLFAIAPRAQKKDSRHICAGCPP